MTRRTWVRLDNASNIFLAARSETDSKVFRLSAEMDDDIDPQRLQAALDATYDRYPLYHAVLRRAVFWYYLQDSDLRPLVTADDKPTCAPIYNADRRGLLFRVVYHHQRIVLEVFHALSDGTGALWFLTDLLRAYLCLSQPAQQRSGEGLRPADQTADDPAHEMVSDSFAYYFRRRRSDKDRGPRVVGADSTALAAGKKVHRVTGTRNPDYRTRAVELTMPTDAVLGLARKAGTSLTMYLTALFFESIRRSSAGLGKSATIAASVPVNLRQFFPSTSLRNFFATIRVAHTYGQGADDVGSIARQLDAQFRPKANQEALEKKLRRLIRFERMPMLRIVPRPLKDVILRGINWGSNRGLSVAVSNLGRMQLPEPVAAHVHRMAFHVSAVRPQMSVISHGGHLTVSFTSPFCETDHIREFARLLTAQSIKVTVGAAQVTEEELTEEQES